MDLEYFYNGICEEIDGAKEYIKKAIELKAMSSSMSKKLHDMSKDEQKHAEYLYDMAMAYYGKITEPYGSEVPKYILDLRDKITNLYAKEMVEVKILISMYED
ncbi:MAG: hypothetical protein J6U54_19740 [Clostridiales bacterium]|nr:hypothetical protein [Clostridiales bacterium]